MKQYPTEKIRNLVILGHGSTGKTTLAEAALFLSGGANRLGHVDSGTTASDFDPDEAKRKTSISTSLIPCEWEDHKVNLIDTPGYADFVGEAYSGLAAADLALIVVCAAAGVQVGTELAWELVADHVLPRAIFINRMDRENADFVRTLTQIQSEFGGRCVAVQLPVGGEDSFSGIVDLIDGKAYVGEKAVEADTLAELAEQIQTLRAKLMEAVAENDEQLLEKFLESSELSPEEISQGLAKGLQTGDIIPVLVGSGAKTIGVARLLDATLAYFPPPMSRRVVALDGTSEVELEADSQGPLAAQVFKTTADQFVGKLTFLRVYSGTLKADSHVWNSRQGVDERVGQVFVVRGKSHEPVPGLAAGDIGAVAKLAETITADTLATKEKALRLPTIKFPVPVHSVAIFPKSKADTDRMSSALTRILEEDPVLEVRHDAETGETILSGLGEAHVESTCEKIRRKFSTEIVHQTPRVPYRETLSVRASAEHTHKKQSGGHGQYAKVTLEIEPLPRGTGFEFVNKTVGGSVPKQYVPAIEHGVQEALTQGIMLHNRVVDLRVSLVDGKEHPVDSSEMAFKLAGLQALKTCALKAHPILLEPVVNVRVRAPEAFTGDLVSDLNGKRAHVLGISPEERVTVIDAQAPMAEMQHYATDLRSLTQGRARFEVSFDHYAEVPDQLAKKIIEGVEKDQPTVLARR